MLRKLARQKLVPGTGRSVQDINTDINVRSFLAESFVFILKFAYSVS